ncbi:MAG: DNA-3-methyladenine glycosylase I [Acetobacteraceae bacterium]|nr:DNA-3-methyladenine glycosylase I [Acetobacteraceae bacterium]
MPSFAAIRKRAEARKGGAAALAALLPPPPDPAALRALPDDRALAEMTRRIFCAGFVWRVIEQKWPGFEAAFHGFDIARLCFEPDEYWEALGRDKAIVRHGAKIMAVRANARFVADIAAGHGSFGRFVADWPAGDQLGLLDVLARRGTRLGGMTGQYLLRFLGRDGWITSRDMVACLRDAGLDISEAPTSRRELRLVQAQLGAWAAETGLPLTHLSRICAMSVGSNNDAASAQGAGIQDDRES